MACGGGGGIIGLLLFSFDKMTIINNDNMYKIFFIIKKYFLFKNILILCYIITLSIHIIIVIFYLFENIIVS